MAISISFNGVVYSIPETGDESWGESLTSFFTAIPQGALQKIGGAFTLTADVNFGANFGLLSRYFSTRSTSPSTAGIFRLSLADTIGWRNNANSANLLLGINASDELVFNGTSVISNAITALTGDVTATGPGSVAATIAANAVTDAKFRQSAALSIVGNATNALANVADISAGTDHFALVRSGTSLAFALLTNANIDPAAAIDFSKLAAVTSGNILVGNVSNVAASVAMSGDITISNAGVTAIGANKVTLGMLATVSTATFLGRTTASTGNVEALTATQATALINAMVGDSGSGGTKGLVPAPAAGDAAASKYLKADGLWDTPAGAGTVTSVAMTAPTALFAASPVSGSPVTTSGTLALALATQSAGTFFAGPTSGSAATPTFRALQSKTTQVFTSGSGTYTTPAGVLYLRVRAVGGGGGGGPADSNFNLHQGGAGGNSTFSTMTAGGGPAGVNNALASVGGTASGGDINISGGGGGGSQNLPGTGGNGGNSAFGGGGGGGGNGQPGGAGGTNTGGGGGGGGQAAGAGAVYGGGAGSGGYCEKVFVSPAATYSYSVGAAGAAGSGGTGPNGGAGALGLIIVEEFYQ